MTDGGHARGDEMAIRAAADREGSTCWRPSAFPADYLQ